MVICLSLGKEVVWGGHGGWGDGGTGGPGRSETRADSGLCGSLDGKNDQRGLDEEEREMDGKEHVESEQRGLIGAERKGASGTSCTVWSRREGS